MKTSQQPTSQSGADEWTCSLEAFRASLSVMPGDAEARKMTATSGRQCIAPSMKSSPLGLWLKTLLESSRWSSRARFLKWQVQPLFSTRLTTFEDDTNSARPLPCNASAQTLKVTDMPSSRCLFRLVPSEPPTDETGCSSSQGESKPFLKTPCTADSYTDQMKSKGVSGTSGTLAQEVVNGYAEKHRGLMMPTPNTRDWKGKTRPGVKAPISGYTYGEQLPDAVDRMVKDGLLPTPTAIEGVKWTNTWNPNSQMGQSLSAMVVNGFLPTPVTQDFKKRGPNSQQQGIGDLVYELANGSRDSEEVRKSGAAGKTSRLSPLFTEEMMGFPLMWTALPFLSESGAQKPSKPTATPSSHKSCTKSSEPSSK